MKRKTAICLLLSLVAITAASTSVSLAWYVNASFLQIQDINVTLSGSSPLLIGTENKKEAFKPALEYDDLEKVEAFEPVSGILQEEWYGAKYPSFYESYNSRGTTIVETATNIYAQPFDKVASEGYYSQELFLYAENDYYAMIDADNTFFQANKLANWKRAEELVKERGGSKTAEQYYDELNKLVDSVRFSVLVDTSTKYDYKVFDPNKNQPYTKLGGLVDTSMMGTFDCAGFGDSRCETLYGDVNDRNLIVYHDEPQGSHVGEHTWYNADHDTSAKQINFEASKLNGLEIKTEDALSLSEYKTRKAKLLDRTATQEEIDSLLMIPVKTAKATRIVVSIYFEGFDIDNVSSTMSSSFEAKITFDVVDSHII